jgi:hypothetical protein
MSGTWILPKQLHTLACALDTEALNLDLNESSEICGQLLFVRSKPLPSQTWLRKWKRDSWTQHLFGRILRPSHTSRFTDEWTSSLVDTRVSHSVQPGSEKVSKTRGIFGRLLQMVFDFSDPSSASLKTSKDISRWGCPTLSKTWQEWVTERRGAYSARLNAVRRTSGSGCSSWPTVTTAEAGKISNRRNYGQIGLSNHPSIRGELNREKSLKTRAGQTKQWPTPDTCSRGDGPSQLDRNTPTLQTEVKQWATPSSREWKGHTITENHPNGFNLTLSNQIQSSGHHILANDSIAGNLQEFAKLNPRWVETLMGLPVGWTMPSCVSPATVERMNSASSETESCQQPPHSHSEL